MKNYLWSICHPENPEVEEKGLISKEEVESVFKNYLWKAELDKLNSMNGEDIHYNPSMAFKNEANGKNLELTAEGSSDNVAFSVWYIRPVKKKVLFGLLGEREVFEEIVKQMSFEKSTEALSIFLQEDYDKLENYMS